MADRTLVKNWLRDARAAVGSDLDDQIEWLEARRVELSPLVNAGDWETTGVGAEGSSTQMKRGVADKARLEALLEAIEKLELQNGDTSGTSRGTMLGFKLKGILP